MLKQTLALIGLTLVACSSAFASTIRIDLVDFQEIQDNGIDGTADTISDGFYTTGSITRLDYLSSRLTYAETSLGTIYVEVPFAEYDISSISGSIVSATLNFTRFSTNAFERLGQISVSGYAADGTVTLADYSITAQSLGVSDPVPALGTSQDISIDVSEFLNLQTSNFVGFRFDMTVRGGSRLLDTSYAILTAELDGGWLATTPAPYLAIETAVVPVPAAVWLFGSALLGLAAMKRKRA